MGVGDRCLRSAEPSLIIVVTAHSIAALSVPALKDAKWIQSISSHSKADNITASGHGGLCPDL